MPEEPTSSHATHRRGSSRIIALICWIFSGASILASLAAIVILEDKGTGIFLGLIAAGICRILLGEVVPRYEKRANAEANSKDTSP
jgi:hypothetical protein